MLLTLDKVSRLSGRRLATSAAQSGRWMSMDAQTSRNAIQDVEQGSQTVRGQQDGQTRPAGTDTMSNQQFFLEIKKMNDSILKMNDSILAVRLELPQMEARLNKEAAKIKEDLTNMEARLNKEAAKIKEDLTNMEARLNKEAAKNKEDLTKLITDTEGRLKDTAAKNKEDLTKLVADTKGELKDGISKVEVSQAKVFATATVGATLVTGFMAFLRIPGSLWGS